jgi:hypothetical protein
MAASGFLVSRIATSPPAILISTQSPPAHLLLRRQADGDGC